MEEKKGTKLFFVLIAVILGWTLFKHFNFKTLKFADPLLDILYLIVFVVSLFLLFKDNKPNKERE